MTQRYKRVREALAPLYKQYEQSAQRTLRQVLLVHRWWASALLMLVLLSALVMLVNLVCCLVLNRIGDILNRYYMSALCTALLCGLTLALSGPHILRPDKRRAELVDMQVGTDAAMREVIACLQLHKVWSTPAVDTLIAEAEEGCGAGEADPDAPPLIVRLSFAPVWVGIGSVVAWLSDKFLDAWGLAFLLPFAVLACLVVAIGTAVHMIYSEICSFWSTHSMDHRALCLLQEAKYHLYAEQARQDAHPVRIRPRREAHP